MEINWNTLKLLHIIINKQLIIPAVYQSRITQWITIYIVIIIKHHNIYTIGWNLINHRTYLVLLLITYYL